MGEAGQGHAQAPRAVHRLDDRQAVSIQRDGPVEITFARGDEAQKKDQHPDAIAIAELGTDRQTTLIVGPSRRIIGCDVRGQAQQVEWPGNEPPVADLFRSRQALLAE